MFLFIVYGVISKSLLLSDVDQSNGHPKFVGIYFPKVHLIWFWVMDIIFWAILLLW